MTGYDQLPINEREAEQFLGIELGLGSIHKGNGARQNDLDDVL